MEQALILKLLSADDATPALPTDLNDLTVFDEHGDGALPAGESTHAVQRSSVRFNVVLDEFDAAPF